MTDLEIKKNVESELNWEPSINAAEIGVAVKDGIVTLTGRVQSYWDKVAAEHAADRVAGVKAVVNELEIRLPYASERTDEDIARAAVESLNWSVLVPKDRIKVKVSKGWITLEGTVDWQFQKTAAEKAVRKLIGVKGVSNLVDVKPQVSKVEVKATIEVGGKLEFAVEYVHRGVGDRPADRDRVVERNAGRCIEAAGERRRLGRPVPIDELHARQRAHRARHPIGQKRVAARE